jgi:hypothetical protein
MKLLAADLTRVNAETDDRLTVHYADGETLSSYVTVIDASHFRWGSADWNTLEFAQMLAREHATISLEDPEALRKIDEYLKDTYTNPDSYFEDDDPRRAW